MKGIAFDILFQNADPDEAEFAGVMKRYGNIVIAASVGEADKQYLECSDDGTCDGYPRPVYQGVPWGHIDLAQDGLTRTWSLPIDPRVLT